MRPAEVPRAVAALARDRERLERTLLDVSLLLWPPGFPEPPAVGKEAPLTGAGATGATVDLDAALAKVMRRVGMDRYGGRRLHLFIESKVRP